MPRESESSANRALLDSLRGLPACSGSCNGGRKQCPTPDACRIPDSTTAGEGAGVILWPMAVPALCLLAWLLFSF